MRTAGRQRLVGARCSRRLAVGQQGEVEQAMAVVIGRPQHLAARQIFIDGRDAALEAHLAGRQRRAVGQARQRGAVGAHQEDRLH